MLTKHSKARRHTIDRIDAIGPHIPLLLFARPPRAIGFAVTEIVVQPVERQSSRSFAHVFQKVFKFFPLTAYADSATAIIRKSGIVRIKTALNHCLPNLIGFGSAHPMCCASFFLKAAARFCVAAQKMIFLHDGFVSALALARNIPSNPSSLFSGWKMGNHFKSFKSLSDEGWYCRHGIGAFFALFSGGRPATTGAHCATF